MFYRGSTKTVRMETKLSTVENRLREREREIDRLAVLGREWEGKARNERRARQSVENECDSLRRVVASLESLVEKGSERENKLIEQLSRLANRPPTIVDQSEVIAAITRGLAEVLNGNGASATDLSAVNSQANEYGQTLAEVERAPRMSFYPSVEVDEWTNQPLPTPGEWTAHSPTSPGTEQTPVHGTDQWGNVTRLDGQPMFQPGMSAPPPTGGTE